jgi:hypothetical protein
MTDIEIAKQVNLENILDIAKKTNIDEKIKGFMSVTSMRQSFNFLSLSLFFLLKYATFVLSS